MIVMTVVAMSMVIVSVSVSVSVVVVSARFVRHLSFLYLLTFALS